MGEPGGAPERGFGPPAVARKSLRLVDCVSFNLMRRSGIRQAFAIDEHFLEQGFQVLPERSGQER